MAADYHSRAAALANDHQAAENDRPQPADIRELYTSSNGDVWFLIRDRQTRKVLVRHQANVHSGGKVTDTTIDEFLNLNGERPEKQALLRLRGVYFND